MTKARDLANAGTALTSVSATELGYLDGVTSAVQTQINTKQATVSGVSDTEIGYLDGVTSAVQTQLDAKAVYPSQTSNSGKYLTTDGSTPSWGTISAGGMTLISTTALSGTTVTLTNLPTDYVHLYVRVIDPYFSGSAGMSFQVNTNAATNARFNKSGFYYRFFNGVAQNNSNAEAVGSLDCTPDGAWSSTYMQGTYSQFNLACLNYRTASPTLQLFTQYRNTSGYGITGNWNAPFYYGDMGVVQTIKFNSGISLTGGTIELWGVK